MSPRVNSKQKHPEPPTDTLRSVLSLCRKMGAERKLPALLRLIAKEAKHHLSAKEASLLLFDHNRCELWSYISLDGATIRFDARLGIAGAAALSGELLNIPDAQQDSRFYNEIDTRSKKRTRTLLAIPLKTHNQEVVGVLEVMNKVHGTFTKEDEAIGSALAEQAALSIESAQTVQELKTQQQLLEAENSQLWKEIEERFSTQHLIGTSPQVQAIVRLIDQIRDSAIDVLITGESGTGKELVAKAIHYTSVRAKKPFVALNCAAIPEHLLESELFGIKRGVATGVDPRIGKFEQANGGTLFLDEVGDLGSNAQAKILRVLQERSFQPIGGQTDHLVDVRILAATNKNLEDLIHQGTFRHDLYYRLKVIHIHTPPLRDVPEDIPLLAMHFLTNYCREMQKAEKYLNAKALHALQAYPWPGNVRELENEMKRLVAILRRIVITEQDLEEYIRSHGRTASMRRIKGSPSLPEAVAQLETQMIQESLKVSHSNQVQTAKTLGISRQGLIKKMKRLGIVASEAPERK